MLSITTQALVSPHFSRSYIMAAKHPLHLEVLGPVRLTNGSIKPVKGRKRQALLAYLLEARIAGKPEVSKIELIDALHPDFDEPRALNALRVEVHEVRAQLKTYCVISSSKNRADTNPPTLTSFTPQPPTD
jgi:DNA-binding SARP family transcriptional activator